MVPHYNTRKDTMTSFTSNAVCEHSLLSYEKYEFENLKTQNSRAAY